MVTASVLLLQTSGFLISGGIHAAMTRKWVVWVTGNKQLINGYTIENTLSTYFRYLHLGISSCGTLDTAMTQVQRPKFDPYRVAYGARYLERVNWCHGGWGRERSDQQDYCGGLRGDRLGEWTLLQQRRRRRLWSSWYLCTHTSSAAGKKGLMRLTSRELNVDTRTPSQPDLQLLYRRRSLPRYNRLCVAW